MALTLLPSQPLVRTGSVDQQRHTHQRLRSSASSSSASWHVLSSENRFLLQECSCPPRPLSQFSSCAPGQANLPSSAR